MKLDAKETGLGARWTRCSDNLRILSQSLSLSTHDTVSSKMATRHVSLAARASLRPRVTRIGFLCAQCRFESTAPAPPLLLKLRNDLKTAMRAKDTNRLNVVRSLLNEVANASKTSTPIKSDLQLLSLLRKRVTAAQQASKEFEDAGRPELQEKENAQISVLNEYAGEVQTLGVDQIREIVGRAVEEMKSSGAKMTMGDVSKRLLAPGGDFDGKSVERSEVARVVKELLSPK